jgi:AAA domain
MNDSNNNTATVLDAIATDPKIATMRPKKSKPLKLFSFAPEFDPALIPRRNWVIKNLLLRGFVTALISPGGTGKSQLINAIGVSLTSTDDFLDIGVDHKANVLIINNEDSTDELKMRVSGICQHHQIVFSQLSESLFMYSGYSDPLILADYSNDGTVKATSKKDELIELIKQHQIDVLIIDPFVSTHQIEENKNSEMDKVVGVFKHIAKETDTAVLLVHHTRKVGTDSEAHAGDVESSRGAKAVTDACRVAITLAKMSHKTADKLDIDRSISKSLFRMDSAKQNYSEAEENSTWFKMTGVQIANSEWIGVPETFNMEPHLKNLQDNSNDIGAHDVAEVLNSICMKLSNPAENLWTDIRPKYMHMANVAQRTADYHIRLLSDNKKVPTRIKVNSGLTDFYIDKKSGGRTSPLIVFREEL